MTYFVLSRQEDEVCFEVMSHTELKKRLAQYIKLEIAVTYLSHKDTDNLIDLMYFPAMTALIIKGSVVVPTAKRVVTKMEIE